MSSITDTLAQAQQQLTAVSSSPRLDAELLLAHVVQQPREYLHTWPEREITPAQDAAFNTLIDKRRNGWPIAYLLGHQAFWTLDLFVTPATLIPRPETELLVETVLQLGKQDQPQTIIDLGTGSGAIALAIAKERPHWQIHASDASTDALAVARNNAQHNYISNISFHHSNWLTALPIDLRADIIVSNPPYIANRDPHLDQGDLCYEPQMALVAGIDGLDAIRPILAHASSYLNPQGWLLLEHGYDQGQTVAQLFSLHGFSQIQQRTDLLGHIRITYGQFTISAHK